MKQYLLFLYFAVASATAAAQFNPFKKGSHDYRVYEHYMMLRHYKWTVYADSVLPLMAKDKRELKPAATEIAYLMAQSIHASCIEQNVEKSQQLLNKADEWNRLYVVRKKKFWNEEDDVHWEGFDKFYLYPLERWRPYLKNKGVVPVDKKTGLPEFPFPPPAASSQEVLPKSLFQKCKNLGDIDQKLNSVLSQQGYEKAYFKVPNGFALVSRLEQFNKTDASSMQDPNRWADQIPPITSFSEYMSALFYPRVGYFRIVVFVVTDIPFSQSGPTATKEEAKTWLREGKNILPAAAAKLPINDNFYCTALIYEYEFTESQKSKLSNRFSAKTHLEKAKLWNGLR
jgi:hypothetical protein